jgi:two-component system cell cycle response regulator
MNDESTSLSTPKDTQENSGTKPFVLIVDDSPTIRMSLSRIVKGEFVALEAENGEEAWEHIMGDERIEVVLTDLSMPVLDGFGLVQRLRSSVISRIQNLPLIVVTAAEDTDAREKAFQAGANDFIAKTSDRVEILARLKAHRKLALTIRQLEESQRELREQANTDTLTGLPNRRYFDQIANRELSLMKRQKEYFAVLMMDIDHFKSVNDTHGHAGGDRVLVHVARILAQTIREEDIVARIGGEEFVVASPYTNRLAAIVLAERLRKAVEALDIHFEGNQIPVTISIGIALQPQDGGNLEDLLAAADERLYIAKQNGRNRFCAADKKHEDREVDVNMVCPKLDEALAMIRHDNLDRLIPHLPKLLEDLIPLFELINEQSAEKVDVENVRSVIEELKK